MASADNPGNSTVNPANPTSKKAEKNEDANSSESESCSSHSDLNDSVKLLTVPEIYHRIQQVSQEVSIMYRQGSFVKEDMARHEMMKSQNRNKIQQLSKLPHLVGHLVETLNMDVDPHEDMTEEEKKKGRLCPVVKSSTGNSRSSYFLPMMGLVYPHELRPGDLLSLHRDTYCILGKLPQEYDSRIKGMEVTEKPTDKFSDIGGMGKQVQELIEAVVYPITKKEKFKALGIPPPKGVLLYGPPGTGKTMMARAVASTTDATFLRLGGTQLIQMFIGEGAKLLRDAFEVARDKAPTIVFIDEIDSIGKKRSGSDSDAAGTREVQRTLIELLNQLDGLQPLHEIKVIAATNRVDILDPALVRSGRIDRKIEVPAPSMAGRAEIMKLHSRKMKHRGVNFEELARCTEDFNGAQCKAVCVEAAMTALRRNADFATHEDFMDGVMEVQEKKKCKYFYYV